MHSGFSVLMSIYYKESKENFIDAIESIYDKQQLKPNEIILTKDGPLTPELDSLVEEYERKLSGVLKVYPIEHNVGLGNALNYGLTKCSYELVARMDTDDIALPQRFQRQIAFMKEHPAVDVSGAALEEFDQYPGDLKTIRFSKENHDSLVSYSKSRNPLNHPTTIYKKSAVIAAGSYIDMPGHEDYYLWIRMILNGAKLANINETFLYFRIGNGMVNRRSGIQYIQHERQFLKAIKALGYINSFQFWALLSLKAPLRLIPPRMLSLLYKGLRKRAK